MWVRMNQDIHAASWRGAVVEVESVDGKLVTVGGCGPASVASGVYIDPDNVTPWVPRVGERVRWQMTGKPSREGTVHAIEAHGASWTAHVGHHHLHSSLTPDGLSPVLDASGRPVVERGVYEPGKEPLRIIANPPGGAKLRTAFATPTPGDCTHRACATILGALAVPGSVAVSEHPDGWRVEYTGSDGRARGLVAALPTTAAKALASAAQRPAYAPRVGDLVTWSRVLDCEWQVADEGCGTSPLIGVYARPVFDRSKALLADPCDLTPLRPTAVGQRVRREAESEATWGTTVGASVDDRICVRWLNAPAVYQVSVASLVRIADAKPEPSTGETLAAVAESMRQFAAMGARPRATPEAVEVGASFGEALAHAVAAEARRAFGAGDGRSREEMHKRAAAAWASSITGVGEPLPEPSPTAARHAGHCPTCAKTTRLPGEVRVHWWACGCVVEPEGVEANHGDLGTGTARDVMVWSGDAYGEGWTLDDAMTNWRGSLAEVQADEDAGKAPSAAGIAEGMALVRSDRASRKAEREKAAARARECDTAIKVVESPRWSAKPGQAVYYTINYAGLPDEALTLARGKALVRRG